MVFAIAIPTTVVSLGLLGLVFSSSYILFPAASSLANLFEYPVWMLSGMLVPVDELAPPLQYVSYVLAPTWGVRAVLVSGAGVEGLGSAAESIAMCLLLCAVYVVIAVVLLHRFERLARSSGTLPLQ